MEVGNAFDRRANLDRTTPIHSKPVPHTLSIKNVVLGTVLLCVPSLSSADPSRTVYTYDGLGRVKTVCDARPASGDLPVYTYDAAGNRQAYSHSRTEQLLLADTGIFSPNGKFQFRMQADGNLVAYGNFGSGWTPLGWPTNTVGSGTNAAAFQSDGNLVLYTGSGSVWSSNTYQYHCATISVQNDGNVVIKDIAGNIVWQTNTGGH